MSPAAAIPSGSVQYMDTGTNGVLTSATLAGGAATATIGAAGRAIVAVYSGDANFLGSRSVSVAQLWIGNGASFGSSSFAPNEIVSLMGSNLAAGTPGSTKVTVTDSTGAAHPATLSYTSPGQINFVLPGNLPSAALTSTGNAAPAGPFIGIWVRVCTIVKAVFSSDFS